VASSRTLGPVREVVRTPPGVEVTCAGGGQRVDVLGDGVVRVRVSPDGAWRAAEDWDVLRVPAVPDAAVAVEDDEDRCVVDAGELRIEVDRASGALRFVTNAGVEIAADAGADAVSWDADCVQVQKRRHPDERHAGFGERSALDQTAGTKTFWNVNAKLYGPDADAMYCSVPVFLAHRPSATYGFYLNALGWSQIRADLGADTWVAKVVGRELDYVVVHGDGPAVVLERLTALLGRIELPPRWAVGYHQSHWGYDSAPRVRAVVDEFERRRLPCDAIHLDIEYMDDHRVFSWDPARFPDPTDLIGELGRRGLRCVTIVDPGLKLEPGNAVFDSGLERDAFVRDAAGEHVSGYVWPGRCVLPDFLRPDVRDWWGELHAVLVDAGVAGIWNDMNEPTLYAEPVGSDLAATLVEVPADSPQGPDGHRVRHADAHNVYGVSMVRSAKEALARLRPDARSFFLTRSGFAGIQRYAAVWTGDNTASWEHLRMSLPMLCNLGLSGVPFVGADIGGFWDDAAPELYARWIQAGVLYPMMRGHSHKDTRPNEPWAFGDEVEAVARQALRLRYELRPYLYTLFHGAATTGAPILRPLLWAFSADPRAAVIEDEVLLGDALLAAPVLDPGQRRRDVYLPAGRWYDWWTGEAHDGPADVEVAAPLDRLPLFGRAGAVVPIATVVDDGAIDDSAITLRVFPGDGAGTIYDDDGETFAYRHGAFALRRYRVTSDDATVTVSLSAVEGDLEPTRRIAFLTLDGRTAEVIDPGGAGGAVEVSLAAPGTR
jgi:alpha-glucosidase